MAEGKTYWLIAVPKTNDDAFNLLNQKTSDEQDLCSNARFKVPDLRVGTLNALLSLSDDLVKMDLSVENVTKKIAAQLFDLIELKERDEALKANNNPPSSYLEFYNWDEGKFPTSQSLQAIAESIHASVAKIDDELRTKATEYNSVCQAYNQEERKTSGNLLTRDLSDIVKQEDITASSEYLDTLFVAVQKSSYDQWKAQYEALNSFVVPRSTKLVKEDSEYGIWSVVVFRKVAEDFKRAARDARFIVRDYVYNPEKNIDNDKKKLESEKDKLKKNLVRWCKTNFSEAFVAWTHLKAVRIFVESVLRYNLPTSFQAIALLPKKGKDKRLRKVLQDLYGHLGSKGSQQFKEDEEQRDNEQYYPYVYLEMNLDFKGKAF